jgi:hypothetical protein
MATFDRFDICEAWYLYLCAHHGGMGSPEYARLSKLTRPGHFKPRSGLNSCADLTANGLEIYLKLIGNELPLVCESDDTGGTLFEMWAGAYADTKVLVRAEHFETAFELLVEWLDDNAPGCLTQLETSDYMAAAEELGLTWTGDWEDENTSKIVEHAEADLSVIGHTTLKNGTHIASHEWGGCEVEL